MTEERIDVGVKHPNRCPYCHDEVRPDQPKIACESCMAWHHRECWDSHQAACSACGRSAVEIASAAQSAALGDRAARVTAALEEAKLSAPALGFPSHCVTGGCSRSRFLLSTRCAEHMESDGRVLALVGGINVVFWVGLVAALGIEPGDELFTLALIFGGFGLLMAIYGALILFARRRLRDAAP